ncbi:TetR/AcrR family transcriptional regulator [Gammaproteobacteria bacterium AB-CW1]|uniref:TetR/AcrR family transcriptional regulator n=1 Tax=Natronospira elongata TaxID=3110268 RepID=A0AAP6JH77_9GAMM|nr:TetR/AcrR family transcriptional regulator [Gammaproteobacteria bacterium AB-CW1]
MGNETRKRMLQTTLRLIQLRGLHGVSLNDILEESGSPRGSLYFHFPGGKEALVAEAMQSGIEEASQVLRECLASASHPADGVKAFFQAAAEEMTRSDYGFGCPVAPIILDSPHVSTKLAAACRAAIDEWTEMYREALLAGGLSFERAGRVANTITASLEGALIMARSHQDATLIVTVGDEVADLITLAVNR